MQLARARTTQQEADESIDLWRINVDVLAKRARDIIEPGASSSFDNMRNSKRLRMIGGGQNCER